MSNVKSTLVRSAAAAAATVLVTMGGIAPALADHDSGNGASQDDHATAAQDGQDAPAAEGQDGQEADGTEPQADQGQQPAQGEKGESASAKGDKAASAKGDKSAKGQGDQRGNGHTPVTVCHLLGNGSYNVLTFDDNALKAHVNHGDIYPVPADGCPADSEDVTTPQFHGTPGHVRVTVCHVLGNGGYHELTFDQHALRAHEAHGDLYPVPAGGCPTGTTEETVAGTTTDDTTTTTTTTTTTQDSGTVENGNVVGDDTTAQDEATVAGVDELASDAQPGDAQVLGVEAVRGVNRSAPVTGPMAGILPQTGAGQLGLAAAAGLTLLGAGAALVARRRTQGV